MQVIDSPEVLQILPNHETLEPLNRLINSLYIREYATYFHALAEVEQLLKKDRYLASHARVYVREMRRKAYAQLLESYRSLSIDYMAEQFGVTRDFIDAYPKVERCSS
jgi:26S proteasome regulatory subunit N7